MAIEWQTALGRDVPHAPTLDSLDDHGRIAHAKVLLEEAIELIEALGLAIHTTGSREVITRGSLEVSTDPRRDVNLPEAAHETTDVLYITETLGVMLGLPTDRLFEEIHQSNMTRILPDGTLLRHPKVNHSDQYRPPKIEEILRDCS
jgi:predicted HAD superfamily Cof-like phosphohydrolase